VDTSIGATLREARKRRKVDLPEVEAGIKIRIRFLRAMENEEWDVLPGGAYTRGFIRTYANFLGLDGERLADDYRRTTQPPDGERAPKRVEPVPTGARERGPAVPGRVLVAVVSVGLVAAMIGIGLAGGEDGTEQPASTPSGTERKPVAEIPDPAAKPGVAVRLAATGEVWVCLLDAAQEPLVDGEILTEGSEAGPFRSRSFEFASGNGSVDLFVDGESADVPSSSSPIGYAVDSEGELTPLEEGERPDCE
jgi:cytoskeleton protein RodZ